MAPRVDRTNQFPSGRQTLPNPVNLRFARNLATIRQRLLIESHLRSAESQNR
jgi:hypothetical protein